MTNDLILKNWGAVLSSLPPSALIDAQFKLFPVGQPGAKPVSESHEFSANEPPELELDGKRLEKITAVLSYNRRNYFYTVEIKLYGDGRVEAIKQFGPGSETPQKCPYPACYPNTAQIKEFLEKGDAVFMSTWLQDFFTVLGRATGFHGIYNIGGGLEKKPETYSDETPETIAAKLLSKAKRNNLCATVFEAFFERDNSTRSDFVDRVTVTIKPNRHVAVEYATYERSSVLRHDREGKPCRFSCCEPRVIGESHEGSNLTLTSVLFPTGFSERSGQDFNYRHVNISEQSSEFREWPNRQYGQPVPTRR